jgi:hypothetical protein
LTFSATWSASSRVGVRISARHPVRALIDQVARGRQDQRAHRMARGRSAVAGLGQQQLDDRQREAGGLAGAGLRRAHDVATLQHDRNRFGLDRRRMDITLFGQGAQDFRRQAEIFETDCRGGWSGFRVLWRGDGRGVGHDVSWAAQRWAWIRAWSRVTCGRT